MIYQIEIKPSCLNEIRKLCKKNPVLENCLKRKIDEIAQNPHHYKPLRHDFAGERRVHIMKSFVLKFEVDETRKTITFSFFGHHDGAYRR